MWDAQTFRDRHNHGLSMGQAAHAARQANAILRGGAPEGTAIAVANKYEMKHRDSGGMVDPTTSSIGGITPSSSSMNPMMQSLVQRYSALPTEKLQELNARLGGTPQGQLIRRVLQQKTMMPTQNQAMQPQQPNAMQAMQPMQAAQAMGGMQPMQQQRFGGITRADGGAAMPRDARLSARPGSPWPGGIRQTDDPMVRQPPQIHSPIVATPDLDASRPEIRRGGATPGFALGGNPMGLSMSMAAPWWERQEAYGADRGASGYLSGATAGRADTIKTQAPSGAYVLPADVVAGLGEGNSLAGARAVQGWIDSGPHGTPQERGVRGRGPPRPPSMNEPRELQAKGGGVQEGPNATTPVALSHGEFVIKPEDVARVFGGGDLRRGHRVLDKLVIELRKRHIKELQKLPGPVKS